MAEPVSRDGAALDSGEKLHVTVVLCIAPRQTQEWTIQLQRGATVADALHHSGALAAWASTSTVESQVGIWGRTADLGAAVRHLDRVEIYRPLLVDPKVARRERFARQGARSTGLFARKRPGSKAGY